MTSGALVVKITIAPDDPDPVRVERQARFLRDELRRLDDAHVHPGPTAAVPDGARGGEVAVAGAMLVEILPLLPHLRALADMVRDWSRRSRSRVTMVVGDESIEIDGATDAQTERLIDLFVERHSR
jgi:hypothetical protein